MKKRQLFIHMFCGLFLICAFSCISAEEAVFNEERFAGDAVEIEEISIEEGFISHTSDFILDGKEQYSG